MFEESFNTEYVLIGKTFAKPVGIVSEREVQAVFSAIDGRWNVDLYYNNKVLVEWSNRWNVLDQIKAHNIFRIMPAHIIPQSTLSDRLTRFNTMRSLLIARTVMNGDWFEKHTERKEGEDDLGFEHRLLKTLYAVFKVIKRNTIQQPVQLTKTNMNIFDKKIFYFNDARVMYSVNEIKTLVTDKVTAPNEIVRLAEGLAFRAGDVTERAVPILNDLFSLTIDNPAISS